MNDKGNGKEAMTDELKPEHREWVRSSYERALVCQKWRRDLMYGLVSWAAKSMVLAALVGIGYGILYFLQERLGG